MTTETNQVIDDFTLGIVELANKIAKSHRGEESEKVKAILGYIDNQKQCGIVAKYIENIGIAVYKKQDDKADFFGHIKSGEIRKIVLSHLDMIKKFNRAIVECEKKGENVINIKEEMIVGALDNLITNAIALKMIELDLRRVGSSAFVFTIGEEPSDERGFKEQCGAENLSEKIMQMGEDVYKNIIVINLDVTGKDYWGDYNENENEKKFKEQAHGYFEYDSKTLDEGLREFLEDFSKGYLGTSIGVIDYKGDKTHDDRDSIDGLYETCQVELLFMSILNN